MPKVLQPALNGGELSPSLYARVDLARYGSSVKTARNFICRQYGGMVNRPGLEHIDYANFEGGGELPVTYPRARVIPFIFSQGIAYVVELSNFVARFYFDGALIMDGPDPFEIATPWGSNEIFDVRFTQSADKMYLSHPDHPTQIITRTTATTFTIEEMETVDGPFRRINSDESIVVSSSAATGNVTITSNTGIFTAEMVGSYFYLESKNLGKVKPWTVGSRGIAFGDLRRSDGKTYKAVTVPSGGGSTWTECGSFRPVHDTGRAWDGGGDVRTDGTNTWIVGIEWEYQDSSYGIVKITGFNSATSVNAVVTRRLPADVVGGAGTPGNSWSFVGDGVTTQFSITGAVATSNSLYSVSIDGVPIQSDPYYSGGGGGTGGGLPPGVEEP